MLQIKIFAGNATPILAEKIASQLNIPVSNALVTRFSDGESRIEILENVRGYECYVIQSTCACILQNNTPMELLQDDTPRKPMKPKLSQDDTPMKLSQNDTLMELLIFIDALRRASAGRITGVVPYFGYARQDRRVRSERVPITASIVANMMQAAGFDRIITVDLHADQIQGFFHIPVDNVYASRVMLDDIRKMNYPNPMIISPDVGGVIRARAFAKRLNDSDLAIIDKRRPRPNQAEVLHVIGEVQNRNCIIVDDMVDTAGTLCHAAETLKANGAATVTAYCTHPILSGSSITNITHSALDEVVVTDTIPLREEAKNCSKIRVLSLSSMLAEIIYRVNHQESVSSMFTD